MEVILIKYAEIALKKRNRKQFERILKENCAKALAAPRARIERISGRIKITLGARSDLRGSAERLAAVFGVHAVAIAAHVEASYDPIERAVVDRLQKRGGAGRTFAVYTRRSSKCVPFTSVELNEKLGRAIRDRYPACAADLNAPACAVFVEIRRDGAYVYTDADEYIGPGGLPVGSAGRALALVSGGIDSPVAAWLAMKRGLATDLVYFHTPPHTGEKARTKVFDTARVLAGWNAGSITVRTPAITGIQRTIAARAPESYWTILLRRSMHRITERIAVRHGCHCAVTGDSIAQVASQTPENLSAIEAASDLLTLRPLTGFDKREIINRAHDIGTYDISIRPHEDCCRVFTPKNPKTKVRRERVERIEAELALRELEESAAAKSELFEVTASSVTAHQKM